ncbi:MAG: hypothetical protein IT447_10540 [Phycisphaerales bacterium]|nr:hypothetical protein [Phycisphaerales bacterium]
MTMLLAAFAMTGRAAADDLVESISQWQAACFFDTPAPARSFERDKKPFVRYLFKHGNSRGEIFWSLAQPITIRPKPDEDFRVTVRYRATQNVPLYVGISSGQGCALPYVRAPLPTTKNGSEWITTSVDLSAFRFQPSNVIWNGSLWLEIFTVNRPEALPVTIDLMNVSVQVMQSQKEPQAESKCRINVSRENSFVVYEVNPISNQRILPESTSIEGRIADAIHTRTARGATVPIGLVVSSNHDLNQLLPVIAPLRDDHDQIAKEIGVDRKIVKVWYQDRNEDWKRHPPALDLPPPSSQAIPVNSDPRSYQYSPMERTGLKLLTPELLLNDDALVVVDESTRTNSVRARTSDGTRLLRLDDPKSPAATTIKDFTVSDSTELLPMTLLAGRIQEFWIDIEIPASVPPGIYHTTIRWLDGDQLLAQTPLSIEIIPVVLTETNFIAGIYYHPVNYTNEPGYPVFYPGKLAWEQTARELKSLARNHLWDALMPGPVQNVGMDTPIDINDLKRRIDLRKAAGLRTDRLFYTGIMLGRVNDAGEAERLRNKVRLLVNTARSCGVEEIYVYSQDEASAEALSALRPAWVIAHEEGAKVFAAGSREDMFPIMGDMLDLFICAGYPDRREAARWHAVGGKIACYSNPQGGLEQPETYRRNYGLLLWQNDYDGAAPYTYHTAGRQSVGSVPSLWDDYIVNSDAMKQHAMAYPTATGVIETIQLRGLREAYTDLQYIHALELAIENHCLSSAGQTNATNLLRYLKAGDINKDQTDPADIRVKIIEYLSDTRKETPQ